MTKQWTCLFEIEWLPTLDFPSPNTHTHTHTHTITICLCERLNIPYIYTPHTHTHTLSILVRTLHRLPLVFYQVDDIFYQLTQTLTICRTLDLHQHHLLADLQVFLTTEDQSNVITSALSKYFTI